MPDDVSARRQRLGHFAVQTQTLPRPLVAADRGRHRTGVRPEAVVSGRSARRGHSDHVAGDPVSERFVVRVQRVVATQVDRTPTHDDVIVEIDVAEGGRDGEGRRRRC